jgi:hypothetical protein
MFLSGASAGWGNAGIVALQPVVPLPAAGNVTVARLLLQGAGRPPKLTVTSRSGIRAGTFVAGNVVRDRSPGRFVATVVIVRPAPVPFAPPAPQPTRTVGIRIPAGFSLVGPARVASNVLYANTTPSFGLAPAAGATLLAGEAPAKLPLSRVLTDGQLLALDRSVPLVEMGLLQLPYVAVDLSGASATSLPVVIGLSSLSQVNAVELRFPTDLQVVDVAGPPEASALRLGNAVQLIASSGFFQQGVPYRFTLRLSRAPRKGEFVNVRASTHYFESSLPFAERFALR